MLSVSIYLPSVYICLSWQMTRCSEIKWYHQIQQLQLNKCYTAHSDRFKEAKITINVTSLYIFLISFSFQYNRFCTKMYDLIHQSNSPQHVCMLFNTYHKWYTDILTFSQYIKTYCRWGQVAKLLERGAIICTLNRTFHSRPTTYEACSPQPYRH